MKVTGRYYAHADEVESYGDYKEKKINKANALVFKAVASVKESSLKDEDKNKFAQLKSIYVLSTKLIN